MKQHLLAKCCTALAAFIIVICSQNSADAATYVVTSTSNGTEAGSVRWAVGQANANPGADIVDLTGVNGTIQLSGFAGFLDINSEITFNGPGKNTLTIQGSQGTFCDCTIKMRYAAIATFNDVTIGTSQFEGVHMDCNGSFVCNNTFTANRCKFVYTTTTPTNHLLTNGSGATYNLNDCIIDGENLTGHREMCYAGAQSTVNATRCTFMNCVATNGWGGALRQSSGTMNLTNCTFFGNSATYDGGAVYTSEGANVTITNCTFYGNRSSIGTDPYYSGGAVAISGTWTVKNSIFWNNADKYGENSFGYGGTLTSGGYNIFKNDIVTAVAPIAPTDMMGSATNINISSSLSDEGGFVPVLSVGRGSVAIDALPAGGNGAPSTDATGRAPIWRHDIGAYEFLYFDPSFANLAVASITPNGFTFSGSVVDDGGAYYILDRGFEYTSPSGETITVSAGAGIGQIGSTVSGLAPNTTYQIKPYYRNDLGLFYLPTISVTTIPTLGEWGLIAFGGLIAVIGCVVVWRRLS